MSNELPYLPFFVGDFLVTVGTWPADRVGAYALALFYQFEHGGLPADDQAELARILHVSRATARRLWVEIQAKPKFHRHDDGLWWNPRMEEVRSTARVQRTLATARAKNAAVARWGKGSNSIPATSNAQALLEEMLGDASKEKESKEVPPKPPVARGARRTRKDRQLAEAVRRSDPWGQREKTAEMQRLIADGMSPQEAQRKAFPS